VIDRLYNRGWGPGNLDLALGLLDPEILWTAIEDAPDAGTYRGHDAVRAYMQDWLDHFDIHSGDLEEVIDAGEDRLICVQRATATGKASGVRTELRYACLYTFRGERIVEIKEYATREEALAAAG
jgi:ketosteroid isomerase-like protein